jgi:excinuclease ABC A subunit
VTVELPVGLFVCVTGVSGSGKSTLINDTLYTAVAITSTARPRSPPSTRPIEGLDFFDKVINVDQSPIGRTPRSNPATLHGLFTPIRDLFAGVPESRARGYGPGAFSFNVKGGRCEACQGDGMIKVEMHFLPDVYVPCDVCHGRRYNRETLEVRYKGRSIAEVLDMTVEQAHEFFASVPAIAAQARDAAGGGPGIRLPRAERRPRSRAARRSAVKLSLELSKRDTGPHALHPRRADHRPAFPRHRHAAEGPAPAARPRQHGGGDRAQPRRDQDRGLGDRPGSRGRRWRRAGDRRRHARGHRAFGPRASPAVSSRRCWRQAPRKKAAAG